MADSSNGRRLARWGRLALAAGFAGAGVLHLVRPALYRPIMPAYLPAPDALILTSGAAEIAGGLGLLHPRTRRAAGVGLLLLLAAVLPVNVEMLRLYRARGVAGWAEALLWLRLPVQPLLGWAVWRVSRRRDERGRPPGAPAADGA